MANNNLSFAEITSTFTNLAINQIFDTYGVSVEIKPKSLQKFGRNDSITSTLETVAFSGGNETYASGNTIDTISSSNSGDTQAVVIEGHTLSGSDLTFVVQNATLTGQSKVVLSTPLYRCSRLYNNGSTNFTGNIYVYEDDTTTTPGVPDTATKIHLKVDPTKNQSEKASTSFSSVDYGIITEVYGGVTSKRVATAEFNLQVREFGKVFRTILNWSSTQGDTRVKLNPHIVISPNSDVRIVAKSNTADTEVIGGFNAYFGLINSS